MRVYEDLLLRTPCAEYSIVTLSFALPSEDDDAVDEHLATEIHHPDGAVVEVVVQDGAPVQAGVAVAVHRQTGPSVFPVLPHVTLVVDQHRVALKRQVLHCL